jgi:Peptidase family C54
MILLRGIAVSIPAEFLHVFMYARTQTLHMFPQLVGIAGGRPSSPYYFVGFQTDNLARAYAPSSFSPAASYIGESADG